MRIAFYAPMKPPDHPTPSGDRRMARLLMEALRLAGHDVVLASRFRSYEGSGDAAKQAEFQRMGEAEAARLIAEFEANGDRRPDLWFTYHLYHKAPDWLGPALGSALGIPYVVAEASHAPKQAGGRWDIGYRGAAEAIKAADRVFCMTRLDMACVGALLNDLGRLRYLPPFIDPQPFLDAVRDRAAVARAFGADPDKHWLVSVAMMRPGDKLNSHRHLARALAQLSGDDWQVLLVGDGPARREVEAAFAPLAARTIWPGLLDPDDLAKVYAAGDLYLWPGAGEAYGMAYLEAQASGLPVVAGHQRGVPDVVEDGITGVLVDPDDVDAFAAAVRGLLDGGARRADMAVAARCFVAAQRDLASAADLLRDALP
jgi:glycosyltransferase involved in cell wall biosynthesis